MTVRFSTPIPPASVELAGFATRWLTDPLVRPSSGAELAACLRLVADLVETAGDLGPVHLGVDMTPTGRGRPEADRVRVVDVLAAALGTYAVPFRLSGGSWHHTTNHREDSLPCVGVYESIQAPPGEDDQAGGGR